MITVLSDAATKGLGQDLYNKFSQRRQGIRHFCLEDMNVEPCYACRGCEEKTYGRCIIRDDADLILPSIMHSETIIVISPIVFGGYSFKIKRIVDKFALIAGRHYYYNNGELVKGKRTGTRYFAIGIHDGVIKEEIEVFKQFIAETLRIGAWEGKAIVIPQGTGDCDSLMSEVQG
jgi:multimeric flavodoxin WrbA